MQTIHKMHVIFQSLEVDLDHEIATIDQSVPYILVTGKLGTKSSQILICCEEEEFLKSKTHCWISCPCTILLTLLIRRALMECCCFYREKL